VPAASIDTEIYTTKFYRINLMKKLLRNKWSWIAVGGLLLIVAFVLIRQGQRSAAAQEPQTGVIVTAFVGDLSASATASGSLEAAQAAELTLLRSGTVAEIYAAVGDAVTAGEPLLQLETADLQRAVINAEQNVVIQETNLASLLAPATEADVAAAEAAVLSAEAQLADLRDGPNATDIAAAEADVRAAQADLNAAYTRLSDQTGAAGTNEIEAAQIQLELAQTAATQAAEQHSTILVTESDYISAEQLADMELAARTAALQANAGLQTAQETLDELLNGNPNSIAAAQASASLAAASLQTAELRLQQVQEGASAAQIAQAEANLANAEASLDRLVRGPSEAQVSMAEAQLAQAQTNLARAQRNLANATLVAPYDGVITAVNVSIGEQASGVVIEMVNPNSLELVLDVDEVDISNIVLGQTAVIILEAFPDSEIEANVVSIAPRNTAAQGSGLVTYDVYLALGTTDLPVRMGMTANASLVTAQRSDVLLVPNRAITPDRAAGKYYVTRADGEVVEVTISLRDEANTQITSGLEEGDELLIETAQPAVTFQPGDGPFGGN
jgi:HlyD family secretion protein